MDSHALEMTAELAAELASNERRLIDPRSQPVRFHNLLARGRSAWHCFESFQRSKTDTLATRLGAGAHAVLLGQPVAVFDQPAKTGKGRAPRHGEAWTKFQRENAGATIVSRKEHDTARRIADSIVANRDAEILLLSDGVIRERTIMWSYVGRRCQSTPDARHRDWLVEFKTTRCAEPTRFVRDATFRGYHAQVAFYRLAIEAETGRPPPKCYIIAVESSPPHVATVMEMTDRAIEAGERLCRGWMELLLTTERSGTWQEGYCSSISTFDIPDPDVELDFGPAGEDET